MEIFRGVGLQDAVEKAAADEFVQNGAIIAVESLGGKELQYFYRSYNDGVEGLSPTDRLFITQVGLEPVLRHRAAELGAQHLFGTELVSFEQHDDHVTAAIRPRTGGHEQVVTADYLVAADGAHSTTRDELGIAMTGRGTFADCITIYFKADVTPLMGDRNLSVVYVNHPGLLGFFRFSITGRSGFLAVFASMGPAGSRNTQIGEDTSTDRCVELVRTALGGGSDLPRHREHPAVERERRNRRGVPGRPGLPGRRCGPRDAAHRRIGWEHRCVGRAQSRVEACVRHRRRCRAWTA
jgi:2-polyprenyl-6-methoxyphenol hydroxylase-like FAD-dependent oxidoreductase